MRLARGDNPPAWVHLTTPALALHCGLDSAATNDVPVGRVSVTLTAWASEGPVALVAALETVTVNVTRFCVALLLAYARSWSAPSCATAVLVIERSARVIVWSTAFADVLLLPFGSGVVVDVTVALLELFPAGFDGEVLACTV